MIERRISARAVDPTEMAHDWWVDVIEVDEDERIKGVAQKQCRAHEVPTVIGALWVAHVKGFASRQSTSEVIDELIRDAIEHDRDVVGEDGIVDARMLLHLLISREIDLPERP